MTTISLPIATTDGQRNTQQRIAAFISELERLKSVIATNSADYMTLLRDFETEREARTNEQNRADALALEVGVERVKRAVAMKLLARMAQAYGDEDVIAMAEVMQDVWAALKAEVGA